MFSFVHAKSSFVILLHAVTQKLVSMTNFEDYVSLRRFDRAWKFMGIDKLLKKNGIQEGDTVNLYGTEFTFSDNRNQEETEE